MNSTRYMIYDGTGPVDGEFFTDKAALFRTLMHCTEPDLRVGVFDHADFRSEGSAVLRDITEEIAEELWLAEGGDAASIALDKGEECVCGLLRPFVERDLSDIARPVGV